MILIAGGTGFIGTALSAYLHKQGWKVGILTRKPVPDQVENPHFHWDPERGEIDLRAFEEVDTIINLTGTNVGSKRWTAGRKKELRESRVGSLNFLFHVVQKNKFPIKTIISSSATGFYGNVNSTEIKTETSPAGKDFLAQICDEWEQAALRFESLNCRVVVLRKGVVIGKDGGMYAKVAPMAQRGLNPVLGSGKQIMPWIDLQDLTVLYDFLLQHPKIHGTYNAIAPQQITMKHFAKALLNSFNKKTWLPGAPAFLIRLALGEMASMMLNGTPVSSEKLRQTGFQFQYDTIEKSLTAKK